MYACRWQIAVIILILLVFSAFLPDTQAKSQELPRVNSEEKLQELLNQSRNRVYYYGTNTINDAAVVQEYMPAAEMKSAPEFSGSNVQETGVDEADIVKTDGNYLYQVRNQEILIIKARPASELSLESTITLADMPQEIFINNNQLVVISRQDTGYHYFREERASAPAYDLKVSPDYYPYRNILNITVFDISNKKQPIKKDTFKMEGNCLSARKIEDKIYIVSTEPIYTPYRPVYYINGSRFEKPYNQIRYFPDIMHDTYLHIGTVSLNNRSQFQLDTYLSSGHNIYCSIDNLYVSASEYKPSYNRLSYNSQDSTLIFKFNLQDGVRYQAQGSVPGIIINQFSMDEYGEYFRIATTTNQWSDNNSKNAVYILNEELDEVSSLTGIAPGEKIYSTRFVDERLYMVTFKQVDPLFVIDLTPENPRILGKLKIPGFSKYLHPYNDNYLIGLGYDTTINKYGGVIQQGIKLSMFDVSNVNSPIEIDQEIIGVGGSYSEACENHLAFLLYNDLLAFPASVYEKNDKSDYGTFDFQGAYIYEVSESGFDPSGRITHLTDNDYIKAGDYWYDSSKNIKRIILIDDNIYTISDNQIKINERLTLKQLNQLSTI